MNDGLTEQAIVFKERLGEIASDARMKRDRCKKKAAIWFLIFAVALVVQNTYFGWNPRPESALEFYTDFLHVIPFIMGMGNIMAYMVFKCIAEVLS